MHAENGSPGWKVAHDGSDFVLTHPDGDVEVIVSTPLDLQKTFEGMPFEVHTFAMQGLKENSIYAVHLAVKDSPRIGLMIPANALGSVDHDKAAKNYFLQYAYAAINAVLGGLCRDSPEVLEPYFEQASSVSFSDLFDDNVCFLVISQSTLKAPETFSLDRILPSLISYGYVPAGACTPSKLAWRSLLPDEGDKLKVSLVSSDLEDPRVITKLLVLAATSSPSILTQFFYLYQVFEYLMETVMRHRLPIVAQSIVDSLQNNSISARDQFEVLGEEMKEKGRLKLLMHEYSKCASDLVDLEVASTDFLVAVGAKEASGIEAVYKVRNFLFHQARNLPDDGDPTLLNVVEAFTQFLPSLLQTYCLPSPASTLVAADLSANPVNA